MKRSLILMAALAAAAALAVGASASSPSGVAATMPKVPGYSSPSR